MRKKTKHAPAPIRTSPSANKADEAVVPANADIRRCSICSRRLRVPEDPLSVDCGGDCWGCVGEIEAELGWPPAVTLVEQEYASGIRSGKEGASDG
jgi:hypothetical protein